MKYESTKEELFDSIYRSYADDVYRACCHLTPDNDLAQEMAQQAFVNFYERMDTLEVECAKAYLIRSARNLLYNYYRTANREWKPDEDEEESQAIEPTTESVEDQYFDEMKRTMVGELTTEILGDLKEHHYIWYEVIHMIFFMDMTHEEVAEKLGITKEVLYSRLHRAKFWIRKNYENDFKKITDTA